MNKTCYRLVWNKQCRAWVAVAEIARYLGKSGSGQNRVPAPKVWPISRVAWVVQGGITLMGSALLSSQILAQAEPLPSLSLLPQGGKIVAGTGSLMQSGAALTVKQHSDRLITDWQSFNIGKDQSVIFQQPSANAVALNRVVGGDRSEIFGHLKANGQVFLINPNGVLFAPGAQISTAGFLASTKAMTNADFMAGHYRLSTSSNAAIINQASLQALPGGYIVLAADTVRNDASGQVLAPNGRAALVAAQNITLTVDSITGAQVQVNGSTVQALIDNAGLVAADGGQVLMTARGRDMLQGQVMNLSGIVRARSTAEQPGSILLDGGSVDSTAIATAEGEAQDAGTVRLRGAQLDVSGQDVGSKGGAVVVSGQRIELDQGSTIDASGVQAGGRVIAGGDRLDKARDLMAVPLADNVYFAHDSTIKMGSAQGDGGFLETSGKQVQIEGVVDGKAAGQAGHWLIDPDNLVVSHHGTTTATGGVELRPQTGGSYVLDTALSAATADVTLDARDGDIYSDSNVQVDNAARSYTFKAVNAGVMGTWLANKLVFDTRGLAGILGAVTGNVASSSTGGADLRLYSSGTVHGTIKLDAGKTLAIYTDKTGQRTVTSALDLNGGQIALGRIDGIATGGNVLRSNGVDMLHLYTHTGDATFDSSTAFTAPKTVQYLAVGGGAGSGGGVHMLRYPAGGGGGELLAGRIDSYGLSHITVGSGSVGDYNGNPRNGGQSRLDDIYARGGNAPSTENPGAGGTSGNGRVGGGYERTRSCRHTSSGGGGGAGQGACSSSGYEGGAGGAGTPSEITGVRMIYGQGGAGTGYRGPDGVTGPANSGQGGSRGLAGGSGIVVLRYTLAGTGDAAHHAASVKATLSGVVSGVGNLTVTSSSDNAAHDVLTWTGNNTYTGGTLASQGTWRVGSAQALGHLSAVNAAAGATVDLNGFNQKVGSLEGSGVVRSTSPARLTLGADHRSTEFSGVLSDGIELRKEGRGTLTLTGNNTYLGTTTVAEGTLQVGNGNTGSIANTRAITNHATLIFDRSGSRETLTFDGQLGSAIEGSGSTTVLSGGDLTVDAAMTQTGSHSQIQLQAGGDVTVNAALTAKDGSNSSHNALHLAAGYDKAAGEEAGGDLRFGESGQASVSNAGRVTIFSGNPHSEDLNRKISGATAPVKNVRYNTDKEALVDTFGTRNFNYRKLGLITARGITARDKIYDGTAVAQLDMATDAAVYISGDEGVSSKLLSANGRFCAAGGRTEISTAGTTHVVTLTDLHTDTSRGWAVSGESNQFWLSGNGIWKARIALNINDKRVTYGADDTLNGFGYSGLVAGETLGTVKLLTDASKSTSGHWNSGDWAIRPEVENNGSADLVQNYYIEYTPGRLQVDPKTIAAAHVAAADRVYDGGTKALVETGSAVLSDVIAGDKVTMANAAGQFDSKDAGKNKTVTVRDVVLGGTDADNYRLADAAITTQADITQARVTLHAKDQHLTYGAGNTYNGFEHSGLVAGETLGNVTLATDAGTSTSGHWRSGVWTITARAEGDGSADLKNYMIESKTGRLQVDPKTIAVARVAAADRVYDGGTKALVETGSAVLSDVVAGDKVTMASAAGQFDSKDAGKNKTVTVRDVVLGGTDADNYRLAATELTTTADIDRAVIKAVSGLRVVHKVKNGTTFAQVDSTEAVIHGKAAGDDLRLADVRGTFVDGNVGRDKRVELHFKLDGADAVNYYLDPDYVVEARADILTASDGLTPPAGVTNRPQTHGPYANGGSQLQDVVRTAIKGTQQVGMPKRQYEHITVSEQTIGSLQAGPGSLAYGAETPYVQVEDIPPLVTECIQGGIRLPVGVEPEAQRWPCAVSQSIPM